MEKNKSRVLIVDDDPNNLQLVRQILNSEYNLSFALNGFIALELSEKLKPDLILLDIMMPEIDGYEVCKRLKANSKTKDIPVIFVTANTEMEGEIKGLEIGAVDYITKPISVPILEARIKTHLELKEVREKLENQNLQLKRTLNLVEDMSYMIVHDMRTPLCSIIGFSEILKINNSVAENGIEFVSSIHREAKRINSFLDDVLILAKTGDRELELTLGRVKLNSFVHSALDVYKGIMKAKNMELVIDVADNRDDIIRIDEKLIRRVIDNLMSNAIKFSPPSGKVTFKAYCKDEISNDGKSFVIKVSDQGPGIEEKDQKKIFDKFETLRMRRNGIPQTGLGLAFCKIAVKAHGGNIFVESELGKGSTFWLEI